MRNRLKEIWRKIDHPTTKFQKISSYIIIPLVLIIFVVVVGFLLISPPLLIGVTYDVWETYNDDLIDNPIRNFIESINTGEWVEGIVYLTTIVALYIDLVLIPFWILRYRAVKKYLRNNPDEYSDEYLKVYKNKEYKLLPSKTKISLILYSIWFAFTFLFFRQSIYNFFKHIQLDNLFGFGDDLNSLFYIGLTGMVCLWIYVKKWG